MVENKWKTWNAWNAQQRKPIGTPSLVVLCFQLVLPLVERKGEGFPGEIFLVFDGQI